MTTDKIKFIVLGMLLALFFMILGIQLSAVADHFKSHKELTKSN